MPDRDTTHSAEKNQKEETSRKKKNNWEKGLDDFFEGKKPEEGIFPGDIPDQDFEEYKMDAPAGDSPGKITPDPEPEEKTLTKKVSFSVFDHNGERQEYSQTIQFKESEHPSLDLQLVKNGADYEIIPKKSAQPIFSTKKLFSPAEEIYFTNEQKEAIREKVAARTKNRIEQYYLSDAPNKTRSFSAASVAEGYKAQYMKAFGNISDFRKSHSEKAKNLLSVLGMKLTTDTWKTTFFMLKNGKGDCIPALHFDNVGRRGAQVLSSAFEKRGMNYEYDRTTGEFYAFPGEADVKDRKNYCLDSRDDYNAALTEFASIQIDAKREGFINTPMQESDIWKQVSDLTELTSAEPERSYRYSLENEKYAKEYLKSLGLNLHFSEAENAFPDLDAHTMQVAKTEIVSGSRKGEEIPFVMIGQISREDFLAAEEKLRVLDLSCFHDRENGLLYVAYSPNGVPSFTNPELIKEVKLSDLKDHYIKNASHTIGTMEAKHLVQSDRLKSTKLRHKILYGFSENIRMNSLDLAREQRVSPKEARREARDAVRRYTRSPEIFYNDEFKRDIMKTRDQLIRSVNSPGLTEKTYRKAEVVR